MGFVLGFWGLGLAFGFDFLIFDFQNLSFIFYFLFLFLVQGYGFGGCWFRGGLVFEAHRLLHHSAHGSRTF